MIITASTPFAAPRRASQPASPPPEPPAAEDKASIAWGNVALMGGATVAGAAAGIYSGLNPGPVAEIVSWGLVPGAAIGGAVLGGVLGEKFSPQFLGEYPAIGGALWGGLAGGALGVGQMFLAGSHASPILATTMGVTGACAGLAGSLALLLKSRD